MKMNVGADTSQFSGELRKARRELKDFEKVSDEALSTIGNAIGVDTRGLEQMASAARGVGTKMTQSSNESVKALGSILTKVNAVTTAVGGLGIGAAVTAFKLLNDEATAFKNTVQGANIEMMTAAYVKVYQQTLHDLNQATGQAAAETGAQVERGLKGALASLKSAVLNLLTGGAQSLPEAIIRQVPGSMVAGQQGERAAAIANEIYQIQRKISDQQVVMADLDAQIAEQKRIAFDTTESTAVQAAAIAKASELIRQKYEGSDGIVALNNALADKMAEMAGLSSSSPAEIDAANQQRITANSLVRQENEELKALSRRQGTLNAQVAKEAEERAKALAQVAAAAKAIADSREALAALDLSTSGSLAGFLPEGITGADGGLTIPVKLVAEEESWKEMESLVAGFVESTAASIGQLVGDLATGGNAWGNFKNAALSAFADMAIAVGKLAISTGVATIGIKKALESLNGYVAIAAGVALVALGSAVKAGLANISSGDYSASASVASASYGSSRSSADSWTARALTVQVEGKLTADGDQLTAVINNTNRRNSHTT